MRDELFDLVLNILAFYEKTFGTEYAFDKLDLVFVSKFPEVALVQFSISIQKYFSLGKSRSDRY